MKRTGLYLHEEIFRCWAVYAHYRGGHMSRNNVLEELTLYLFCPELLGAPLVAIIEEAIAQSKKEIEKQGIGKELGKTVTDGKW